MKTERQIKHLTGGIIRVDGYTVYRTPEGFACDGETETVRGTLQAVIGKIDEWIAAGDVRK